MGRRRGRSRHPVFPFKAKIVAEGDFGPRPVAQSVRDGAGPQAVVQGTNGCPTGGTSFNTGTNIQTLITGTSNAVFVAAGPGAYTNFRGISCGTTHPRFVFPGLAGSYSITGPGAGTAIGLDTSANGGLEVYGGTWSQYGNSEASANYSAPFVCRGSSVIQDAVVTSCQQGGGFDNSGSSGATYRFTRNKYLSNLRYGQSSFGTYIPMVGATVEYCIFEDNNTGGRAGWAAYGVGDDAGTTKYIGIDNMVFRNNWMHDNYGFGLWLDGHNRNVRVHDNVVERDLQGLFYEISLGGSIFEHNLFKDNGAPSTNNNYPFNANQITVSCSPCDGVTAATQPNVTSEIRYNIIDSPAGAAFNTPVILMDFSRGDIEDGTRNWYVHHNQMWVRAGVARIGPGQQGLHASWTQQSISSVGANNRFDFNEYHLYDISAAKTYWEQDTADGMSPGPRTWAQFQAAGQEANGTRVLI